MSELWRERQDGGNELVSGNRRSTIRGYVLIFVSAGLLLACGRRPPVTTKPQAQRPISWHDSGKPLPAGTRLAIQFNGEPAIIQVSDGLGGPPMLYRGQELKSDQLKSIIILKTKEARERFGDQTLDGAILIEFK
jgi:hypothetical protein